MTRLIFPSALWTALSRKHLLFCPLPMSTLFAKRIFLLTIYVYGCFKSGECYPGYKNIFVIIRRYIILYLFTITLPDITALEYNFNVL